MAKDRYKTRRKIRLPREGKEDLERTVPEHELEVWQSKNWLLRDDETIKISENLPEDSKDEADDGDNEVDG